MRIYQIIAISIMLFYLLNLYSYADTVDLSKSIDKSSFKEDIFQYLDSNFYEYYAVKNNSVLNLAPKVYFQGLDNRSINFTINDLKINGLNLPLNNFNMINKYFLSSITVGNYTSNNSSIIGNNFVNYKIKNTEDFFANDKKSGISYNTSFKTSNPTFVNTITQQDRFNNIKLVVGINYTHLKNGFNHNVNGYLGRTMLENWNSIIDFEYKSLDQSTVFRFTNINYLNNEHKSLQDNDSKTYFKAAILKQHTIGNIFIFSYEDNPEDSSLWHYTSSLAISNQNVVINNSSKLLNTPQIYYRNIAYKAQNISTTQLLNNTFILTYGVNLNQDVTKHNKYNDKFLWVKGKENTYQIYLQNKINTFNFNRIYFIPGITFNYTALKPEGLKHTKYNLFIPSLDVELFPVNNIMIYANYLYNTRIPNIYERYVNGKYFYNDYFVTFLPNPDLRKERSNKFTGGIKLEYSFYDTIKLYSNMSMFYYKIHNYIDYHFLNTKEIMFSNLHRAVFRGYNIMIGCDIWNLSNQITYNTVVSKDNNGQSLNNITPSYFIVDSSYKFQTINLTPVFRARFFNSFNGFSNNYPYKKDRIPGYALIDLYLKYTSNSGRVALALGVENVFNKKYFLPYILNLYKDRTYFFNLTINL